MSIEAMKQTLERIANGRDSIEVVRNLARQALSEHRLRNIWIGLTEEEIRQTDHHMVIGAYHYSFKQGARWAEDKLKEKNHVK